MNSLIGYLNCGRIRDRKSTPAVDFIVNSYDDITNKVIIFLKKYPLQTVKKIEFKDFCLAADMIGKKEHLTVKDLNSLIAIKDGMNKKRLSYI